MKTFLVALLLSLSGVLHAGVFDPVASTPVCSAVTSTAAQTGIPLQKGSHTFQAVLKTTSGAGSGTVLIEGSVDTVSWNTVVTLSPTSASATSYTPDVATDVASKFMLYRCRASSLSGTGANYAVYVGY